MSTNTESAPRSRPAYVATIVACSDAAWDQRVLAAGGGVFHSSAWAKVEAALGGQPMRIELQRDGEPLGLALAAGCRSRYPLLSRLRNCLVLKTMPVVAAGDALPSCLESVAELARAHRFVKLTVGTGDSDLTAMPVVSPAFVGEPRLEFRLDLSRGHDAVLRGMSEGHRRNVRKAHREGLVLVEDSTLAGAAMVRDMQDDTFARRRRLGHVRGQAWQRRGYERTTGIFLDSGVIRFWFAVAGGERVAGVGVVRFGDRAYYLVGGTSPRGYENRAVFFLFDEVLRELAEDGVRVFSFGGTPAEAEQPGDEDHGLYRFKIGFGCDVLRLANLSRRV